MVRKRKTFFLDQGEFLGGAERFLIDFLKKLNPSERQKINPVLIGGKNLNYKKLIEDSVYQNHLIKIIPFDYPQVHGNFFIKILSVFALLFKARSLVKLAQKNRATQFFSNTPRTHFIMFFAKKIFRLKGRWICIFHDFTTRPNFLLRAICNESDVLIANSLPTRKFLRQKIAEKNFSKIRLIENGIDFVSLPLKRESKKIEKILIMGRIDPQKGQEFAVKVARKFPQTLFSIVGSPAASDERTLEYEKKIKKIVQKKNITNVSFFPEVSNPFLEISKHDLVLVLPTKPETFGRIVIEALALGKLVLSFDETGPREILQNFYQFLGRKKIYLEKNPFLVKPQNKKDLAKKISFFIKNPQIISELSEEAIEFVQKNYNLLETKKRFLGVLTE